MNRNLIYKDGDELLGDDKEAIKDYLFESKNNFFIKDSKWKINFVGYVKINMNDITFEFFSFPKQYNINSDDINNEMYVVLKSIMKSKNKYLGIAQNENYDIDSEIINLQNVMNYYYNFGLYQKINKLYECSAPKNINFNKTINKIVPFYNNKNYIYPKFINVKKSKEQNFITDCMAYMLEVGIQEYVFYFKKCIKTNHAYNKKEFNNKKFVVQKLKKILENTFDDITKFLIENMIEYFGVANKSMDSSKLLCTTNYELVWEKIVASMLGYNFESQKEFIISDTGHKISIDHYSENSKKIFDSKYYKTDDNFQNNSVDYKQLFYQNHIVPFYNNKDAIQIQFEDNKSWENALIKPAKSNKNGEICYLIKRNTFDNVNIKEYYIDCKRAIYFYIYGRYNPYKELKELENKIDENSLT